MTNRTPRDLETREMSARPAYRPPSSLPDPHPRQGLVHRWIATHVVGEAMPQNVSMRLRDGWVPVKAADYPELNMLAGKGGNVEVGGLMLCAMSAEQAQARDEYYANQASAQMQSVDNTFMRVQDSRMPLFTERKSGVTRGFGTGTK